MSPELTQFLNALGNLGIGGSVILVVILFLRDRKDSNETTSKSLESLAQSHKDAVDSLREELREILKEIFKLYLEASREMINSTKESVKNLHDLQQSVDKMNLTLSRLEDISKQKGKIVH